jgi:predicted MPP superfamily phosphohydrolase
VGGVGARIIRLIGRLGLALIAFAVAILVYGYAEATRAPAVVRYTVRSPGWTAPPITIALLSDTHAALPDMPPARLARVCDAVSALRPDLVLLAGDYVSSRVGQGNRVPPAAATAPFGHCRARLGVFAVLGNHDMRPPVRGEDVATGLQRAGVSVLRNAAVRVGGFWIAGVDNGDYGNADVGRALARVPAGAPLLFVMHNPDRFADLPARRVGLSVAGHTHGGQVAPFGPIFLPIVHREWARGLVWDRGRPMVVTSGVGASFVPIRIGVPPEIALIRLEGAQREPAASAAPPPSL